MFCLSNIAIHTVQIRWRWHQIGFPLFVITYEVKGTFSLITKVWYISLTKRKYKNNKHKKNNNNNKNKNTTKTKILNLWLGSPWISSLLGLRDSGVWGPAFALIFSLGSFGFFPFASIWVRVYWSFHRGRRSLICCGHLRHLGRLRWGRGARTWELTDVWIIIDALRSP